MSAPPIPSEKPLVYAVDHSAEYRLLLQQVFTQFIPDYALQTFDSCPVFMQTLNSGPQPGLVLLDMEIPDINGSEVVAMIRSTTTLKYVPIIMMSETERPEDISACYKAGANSFLVKPLNLEAGRRIMQSICLYWFEFNQQG